MKHGRAVFLVFVGAAVARDILAPSAGETRPPASGARQASPGLVAALQNAGTAFVANAGQWDAGCRYRARFGAMQCEVRRDGWTVLIAGDARKGIVDGVLRFSFEGCQRSSGPIGEARHPGRRNYFLGEDPAGWRTDVPAYGSVLFREIAPGIDLRLREQDGLLEYDVIAGPAADLEDLRIVVEGTTAVAIDPDGALVCRTPAGDIRQPVPVSTSGAREVACSYRLRDARAFGFAVRGWDRAQELVIDPALTCSTYLGGTGSDFIRSIADGPGPVVTVCGNTNGNDFPTTPNAYDRTYGGGGRGWPDAYVVQLDLSRAGAAQLVYGTYLGGPGIDGASAVMVDDRGIITMVGGGQLGFPTTSNAYRQTIETSFDPCIVRLDPSRSGAAQLVYSTFLGGNGNHDEPFDATLDSAGRVAVSGITSSTNLPVTPGAIIPTNPGSSSFVICLDPTLPPTEQIVYCTYVGGTFLDVVRSIDAGPDGTLVLAGYTDSEDLATTPDAYQSARASVLFDAFVWVDFRRF